jgi:ethanolamine utilization microcompartment shell protein EutL
MRCTYYPDGIICGCGLGKAFGDEVNILGRDNPTNTRNGFPNVVKKLLERTLPFHVASEWQTSREREARVIFRCRYRIDASTDRQ